MWEYGLEGEPRQPSSLDDVPEDRCPDRAAELEARGVLLGLTFSHRIRFHPEVITPFPDDETGDDDDGRA